MLGIFYFATYSSVYEREKSLGVSFLNVPSHISTFLQTMKPLHSVKKKKNIANQFH